jgi:hypothetical protein
MLVEPKPYHAGGAIAIALTGSGSRSTVNFCSSVFLSSWQDGSVADPDLFGQIRILTSERGSGSLP